MTLLIFAHVDSGHHVLIIEKKFSQCLGKLCLADSGGSHKQKRTNRAFLILESGARPSNSIRDSLNGIILPHNPLMQRIFHPEQLLPLALQHPLDRNTRPLCYNLCNIFRRNSLCNDRILDCRLTFQKTFYLVLGFRHLAITNLSYLAVVTSSLCIIGLDLIIFNPLPCSLKFRKYLLFIIPSLPQLISLPGEILKFRLDLVCLDGNSLSFHCLLLNLKLTNAAVKFRNRLRYGIHLKTKL